MSSRFGDFDDYRDHPELDQGRWEHNVVQTLKGKRGQAALAELETALRAMPERRLIRGEVCHLDRYDPGFGWSFTVPSYCLVGLYAALKGARPEHLALLGGEQDTAEAGANAGITYTMAWEMGYQNDEMWWDETPEARWERALAWVRKHRQDPG